MAHCGCVLAAMSYVLAYFRYHIVELSTLIKVMVSFENILNTLQLIIVLTLHRMPLVLSQGRYNFYRKHVHRFLGNKNRKETNFFSMAF